MRIPLRRKRKSKKPNKKGSVTTNHCYAATPKKSQNPLKNLTKKATKIHTEKLTQYILFYILKWIKKMSASL